MTDTLPEFQPFAKIPRLRRDITITEKIDGTNAQIYVPEDNGPLLAGSRNRWLYRGQEDNAGFGAWVYAHEDELRAALGPGRHYGEWYGAKIARKYGLSTRHFALFNTARWHEAPPLCQVVPILYEGVFSEEAINTCLDRLRYEGSVMVPGFMQPEGITVYVSAAGHYFKVLLENDELPKGIVTRYEREMVRQ